LNSFQALVVPGLFSAFGVFLLRQFFLGLPRELEEAARLDGAGPARIYWSIVLLPSPCWSCSGRGTTRSGRWWSTPIRRR
jgi:ABC-type maltose transport system permease subunit